MLVSEQGASSSLPMKWIVTIVHSSILSMFSGCFIEETRKRREGKRLSHSVCRRWIVITVARGRRPKQRSTGLKTSNCFVLK